DPTLLAPVAAAWDATARGFGRPTIPIERLVRLMVIKHRCGWGYETLVREVSDSLHLRRFCRIALTERVPDESTVRKLVGRLGPAVIEQITRAVVASATCGERRVVARAARIDSTVVEADIRYPTDLGLAADATRMLARQATAAGGLAGTDAPGVRDRSRAVGKRLRRVNRTLAARTGQGWPIGCDGVRAAAAHRPSWPPLGALTSWRIGRGRWRGRSASAWRASGSPIGWSRSATRMLGRFARASCARRPSLGTSSNWLRYASTPAAGRAA